MPKTERTRPTQRAPGPYDCTAAADASVTGVPGESLAQRTTEIPPLPFRLPTDNQHQVGPIRVYLNARKVWVLQRDHTQFGTQLTPRFAMLARTLMNYPDRVIPADELSQIACLSPGGLVGFLGELREVYRLPIETVGGGYRLNSVRAYERRGREEFEAQEGEVRLHAAALMGMWGHMPAVLPPIDEVDEPTS